MGLRCKDHKAEDDEGGELERPNRKFVEDNTEREICTMASHSELYLDGLQAR